MRRFAFILALISAGPSFGGGAVVDAVSARQSGDQWSFSVTLSHADTGWDHYADGWRVESMDGAELGYRKLHHPHVNEQPFTRSLSGVEIPVGTKVVLVRPHDSVHGWGDAFEVTLP